MSMHPYRAGTIPAETVRVAHAAFPKECLCLRLRDVLGPVFTDDQFADLFAVRGRPAETPWRLALITILQYVENLSDRQAAEAVRSRIDWKYLLGLDLTDPGFDHSVLCEFRTRLSEGSAETRLLNAIIAVGREHGWLKARGKQRTDSTHVLMAARALHRLEGVGETLRAALNALAASAPDWLRERVPVEWFDRYGRRIEEYRLPKGEEARRAYAEQIGADGQQVLGWIALETAPDVLGSLPAMRILRQVWQEHYRVEAGRVRWRTAAELPSAGERIESPYDPDAHYGTKRTTSWVGYKVHLTETCDEDTPHVIIHVLTTSAAERDIQRTLDIEAALMRQGLPPAQHLVDAGYVGADELVQSREQYGIDLLGAIQTDGQWQAKSGDGYDVSQFVIDWDARQAHCPQGKRSRQWCEHQRAGMPLISIKFAPKECRACPVRAQCTKAQGRGRTITVHQRREH